MGNHHGNTENEAGTTPTEDPQVRLFSLPMGDPVNVFKLLEEVFGPAVDRTGPVSLNRDDIEMLADAMVFYHSAMRAITEQGFAVDNDTAHAQYHETGSKLANILERVVKGDPTLTLQITPF